MKKLTIILVLVMLAFQPRCQERINKSDLDELKSRMVGSFSSELQSRADSAYYDIRLHMAQIWDHQRDGYWLYIEQAVATSLSKPYRQRIYHVYQQDDSTLVSKVFEIRSPMRYAGAWANPQIFKELNKDSLIDRQGCAIFLHKNKLGDFAGSTPGKECLSTLRGATYATSEVVIEKDQLVSWDRGWSKEDKQLWGAVKAGYRFIKQKAE